MLTNILLDGGKVVDFETLLFEKKDNVGIISINRPRAMNSLNSKVLYELDILIDEIQKDKDVYIVVLTGKGKAFVAGADIPEMKDKNSIEAKLFSNQGISLFRKIELMEKPIIAAVNGYALGGGCELAMCCDIRIGSDKAKFGQPEVGLGITPGFGGTQRLPRLVGEGRAKEIIFTCDIMDSEEAYRIGLLNKVVPAEELMDKAIEMANKIASKGQIAVRYSKASINKGMEVNLDAAMEIEEDLFSICFSTEDQKEGMKAFLEKRKPEYKLR